MTKLEEVARAISRCCKNDSDWELRKQMARAAVEALRVPSEVQYDALCATDLMWVELNSAKVWEVYIDAILNEKPNL